MKAGFINKYKKGIIIFLLLLIGILGIYYLRNPLVPKLSISNHVFTYELAVTSDQVTRGLSGHVPLADDHGMLFVFDHEEQFHFWMKDMTFPLDMIWIEDKTVMDISKNVPVPVQGENLPIYTPNHAVNRVFEVNAGTADRLGINPGDKVEYLRK